MVANRERICCSEVNVNTFKISRPGELPTAIFFLWIIPTKTYFNFLLYKSYFDNNEHMKLVQSIESYDHSYISVINQMSPSA